MPENELLYDHRITILERQLQDLQERHNNLVARLIALERDSHPKFDFTSLVTELNNRIAQLEQRGITYGTGD